MGIHDFDRATKSVSIGLVQYLIVDRLIKNGRVTRNRRGYATYTDKPQYGIITDLLARKWGVGIDKE